MSAFVQFRDDAVVPHCLFYRKRDVHPASGALNGIQDAMFNWYYGHNVLGLWFTTLGIPAIYYSVPRIIKRPLYSHLLSIISFFSIAFFYTGVGAHHLLQAPIPEWVKTIGVIMSVLLLVSGT